MATMTLDIAQRLVQSACPPHIQVTTAAVNNETRIYTFGFFSERSGESWEGTVEAEALSKAVGAASRSYPYEHRADRADLVRRVHELVDNSPEGRVRALASELERAIARTVARHQSRSWLGKQGYHLSFDHRGGDDMVLELFASKGLGEDIESWKARRVLPAAPIDRVVTPRTIATLDAIDSAIRAMVEEMEARISPMLRLASQFERVAKAIRRKDEAFELAFDALVELSAREPGADWGRAAGRKWAQENRWREWPAWLAAAVRALDYKWSLPQEARRCPSHAGGRRYGVRCERTFGHEGDHEFNLGDPPALDKE